MRCVELLLADGRVDPQGHNAEGLAPLDCAKQAKHRAIIEQLEALKPAEVKRSSDRNPKSAKKNKQKQKNKNTSEEKHKSLQKEFFDLITNPTHQAFERRRDNVQRLLADPELTEVLASARDEENLTALLRVVEHKEPSRLYRPDILRALLACPAIDITATDAHGNTALHLASTCGNARAVTYLLGDGRSDLEAHNDAGQTPLECAEQGGHTVVAAQLRARAENLALPRVKPSRPSVSKEAKLTFVTVLTSSGGEYLPEHVEQLRQGIAEHCSVPHRFFCLSDQPLHCPWIPLEHDWEGWWSKLEIFKHDFGSTVYFDLDTLIVDNLNWMVEAPKQFSMIKDFRQAYLNSGMMAWTGDKYRHIADTFKPDQVSYYHARWPGDGGWIREHMPDSASLQERFPGKIISWKISGWSAPGASVVCSYGTPRPWEVAPPLPELTNASKSSEQEYAIKKFSILTPSRNRPVMLKAFIDSVFDLCEFNHRVEMMVYVDSDDPAIDEYRELEAGISDTVEFVYGEPMSISKSWNILAKQCSGDVLIMGNDDLIYRTENWDTLLEKELIAYPDDIYCAWMQDKSKGKNHCAFPIVSRLWYETLDYFTPGIFHFGYNDTWIFCIAKLIGRCHFIPHIIGEHKHCKDDTYLYNRSQRGNLYHKDKVIFNQKENQIKLQSDAEKLMCLIEFKMPMMHGSRYTTRHVAFYKMWQKEAGYQYIEKTEFLGNSLFHFEWNGLKGVIDFIDFSDPINQDSPVAHDDGSIPVFKAHYNRDITYPKHYFPFAPMMCTDAPQSKDVHHLASQSFETTPKSGFTCKQRVFGNATQRRTKVHALLKKHFPDTDLKCNNSPIEFWDAHKTKLAAICVPGATNNMLDRGQAELMMLGVCTISPYLPEVLLDNVRLEPNEDYLQCADDYSDLIDICKSLTPKRAKQIGDNARAKMATLRPKPFWDYVIRTLKNWYGNPESVSVAENTDADKLEKPASTEKNQPEAVSTEAVAVSIIQGELISGGGKVSYIPNDLFQARCKASGAKLVRGSLNVRIDNLQQAIDSLGPPDFTTAQADQPGNDLRWWRVELTAEPICEIPLGKTFVVRHMRYGPPGYLDVLSEVHFRSKLNLTDNTSVRLRKVEHKDLIGVVATMCMWAPRWPDSMKTIHSLENQVDTLYLCLNDFWEVPEELKQGWIEILHFGKNLGDASRLYLLRNLGHVNAHVITCDDDIEYPEIYVQNFLTEHKKIPECIIDSSR